MNDLYGRVLVINTYHSFCSWFASTYSATVIRHARLVGHRMTFLPPV